MLLRSPGCLACPRHAAQGLPGAKAKSSRPLRVCRTQTEQSESEKMRKFGSIFELASQLPDLSCPENSDVGVLKRLFRYNCIC